MRNQKVNFIDIVNFYKMQKKIASATKITCNRYKSIQMVFKEGIVHKENFIFFYKNLTRD